MKYPNGDDIRLGDRLKLWDGGYGVVVCSFDTDEYTPDCPKEEWGYLKKGVLIRSDQYGLIHYLEPEEGFELVRRAMNYA